MARQVVGLDLGTYSIKIVCLESRGRLQDFQVINHVERKLNLSAEKSADEAALGQRQKEIIEALKTEGLLEGDVFISGLSSRVAQMRSLEVPFVDAKKVSAVLPGILDAHTPFDISDLVYCWMPQSQDVALGDGGSKEVVVGYARKKALAEHLSLLNSVGIDPRIVNLKSAVLYDLFAEILQKMEKRAEEPSSARCAVIDIGHRGTNICVMNENRIFVARSLLRAGIDMTRSLSKKLGTGFDEAEKLKTTKAFFIVTNRDEYADSERQISDALVDGFQPIVREVRRTVLSLYSKDGPGVERIYVTGGGSRIANLDKYLSDAIGVPVIRASSPNERGILETNPQFAIALGYALQGNSLHRKQNRLNFRVGDFSFRGELSFLRKRAAVLGVWGLVIFGLLAVLAGTQRFIVESDISNAIALQNRLCKNILGKEVRTGSRCLAMIREQMSGYREVSIPEFSAADVYLELARTMPKDIEVKVTDLEVTEKQVRLQGETSNFEQVDEIVEGLSKGLCFAGVEKGKARQVRDGVDFQISIQLDCAAINLDIFPTKEL